MQKVNDDRTMALAKSHRVSKEKEYWDFYDDTSSRLGCAFCYNCFMSERATQKELAEKISEAREQVEVGAKYYHFKNPNDLYVIEQIGILEATEEVCVVYRALYGKEIVWIRTLEDFTSEKETEDGKVIKFTKID